MVVLASVCCHFDSSSLLFSTHLGHCLRFFFPGGGGDRRYWWQLVASAFGSTVNVCDFG